MTWSNGLLETMREIRLAKLDKTRPVVILTRQPALAAMTKATVAPITSTIKGLSSEVLLDSTNGIDHRSAIAVDNITTIPSKNIGRLVGYLSPQQEIQLARAITFSFDLDIPLTTRHKSPR